MPIPSRAKEAGSGTPAWLTLKSTPATIVPEGEYVYAPVAPLSVVSFNVNVNRPKGPTSRGENVSVTTSPDKLAVPTPPGNAVGVRSATECLHHYR